MSTGKTGELCLQSGVYCCSKHKDYEIALSEGEPFPPCKTKEGLEHGATYELIRPTKPSLR